MVISSIHNHPKHDDVPCKHTFLIYIPFSCTAGTSLRHPVAHSQSGFLTLCLSCEQTPNICTAIVDVKKTKKKHFFSFWLDLLEIQLDGNTSYDTKQIQVTHFWRLETATEVKMTKIKNWFRFLVIVSVISCWLTYRLTNLAYGLIQTD